MAVKLEFISNAQNIVRDLLKVKEAEKGISSSLDDVNKKNKEVFENGGKNVKEYSNNVDKAGKSMKETFTKSQELAGNLGNQIKDAFGFDLGPFGTQLGNVRAGFATLTAGVGGTSKAFRILKIAMASTGILLLVGLLASLVSYFKSTEEGASRFRKVMIPFEILFGNLSDLAAELGESIVDTFSNPVESVKKLWEAIKTNIVNRITGLADSFRALGGVISSSIELDFTAAKEHSKELAESMAQTLTGVDNLGEKVANGMKSAVEGVKNLASETSKEIESATKLEEAHLALVKRKRVVNEQVAKMNQNIAKLRAIAIDEENYSAQERYDAITKAIELEKEKMTLQVEIAKEQLRQKQLADTYSASSQEDLDEESRLQVALTDIQTQMWQKLNRMITRQNGILKQVNKTKEDANKLTEEQLAEMLNAYDLDQKIALQKKELIWFELDDKKEVEKQKTIFELQQQKERLKYMIKNGLIKKEKEIELAKLTIQGIDQQIDATKKGKGQQDFSFWKLVGLDPEKDKDKIDAFGEFSQQMMSQIKGIADARVQAAERSVQAVDREIAQQQQALNRQNALRAAGKANSVETEKKRLQDLEIQRKKALQQQERAKKAQLNIDAALQLSGMITSSVNIFKVMSKIPFIGVPLAIGMIATMFGAFAAAQVTARSAVSSTKYAKGGRGKVVNGKLHSQGGEPLLDHVEVEDGENIFITNRRSSKKYAPLLDAINNNNDGAINKWFIKRSKIDRMVDTSSINRMQKERGAEMYNVSLNDGDIRENTRAMKILISKLDNQRNTHVDSRGNIIEQNGNVTRIIRQNV